MAINSPNLVLRIIWMVHFIFTTWAIMSAYLSNTPAYLFTQMGVLAMGFWAIVSTENINAILMFLITLCFSVINDILIISIYQPRADDTFERRAGVPAGYVNEYRWALGMSIVNLLLKPVSIFLVFLIYRSGSMGSEFNIRVPGLGAMGPAFASRPGQGQYTNIESAQDSHPGVYGRPPYHQYGNPPPPQQAPPLEAKTGPQPPPSQV